MGLGLEDLGFLLNSKGLLCLRPLRVDSYFKISHGNPSDNSVVL